MVQQAVGLQFGGIYWPSAASLTLAPVTAHSTPKVLSSQWSCKLTHNPTLNKTRCFLNVGILVANTSQPAKETQHVNKTTLELAGGAFLLFCPLVSSPHTYSPCTKLTHNTVCPLNVQRLNWYQSFIKLRQWASRSKCQCSRALLRLATGT